MSLVEVRELFVKKSGRYDLVVDTTDWADNGADVFINAGQNWLDRAETIKKSYARVFEPIADGDWYKLFPLCRAVKEVWCSPDDDDEKWKLEKKNFDILREAYAESPTSLDTGSPLYYSPICIRTVPEAGGEVTIDWFGTTKFGNYTVDHFEYNGLVFMPPADGDMTLEIHGLFYHPKLVQDTDQNYWTEVNPLALVMAACRMLEATYRNTQGVKDWEMSIKLELQGLGMDLVEEESADADEIEG